MNAPIRLLMSNDTNPATVATRKPSQYGLLGLFLLVFSVALGLAALTPDGKNWFQAALTTLLFWILLGLGHQVRDLWRTYHGRKDLDSEQRWGWCFALGWRVAVIVALAGNWLAILLEEHRVLDSSAGWLVDDWPLMTRWPLGDWPTVHFSLLIVLASVPRQPTNRRASRRSWLLDGLGWLAALGLGFVLLAVGMIFTFFAHCTTVGMTQADPAWLSGDFSRSVHMAQTPFCAVSLFAGGLFLVNLLFARQLSRGWDRGRGVRWAWTALLSGGLAAACACVIWVTTVGLPWVSPFIAQTYQRRYWSDYAIGLVLAVFLVTTVTYRMVGSTARHEPAPGPSWRCRPARYYHERSTVIVLLIVLFAMHPSVVLCGRAVQLGFQELLHVILSSQCLALLVLLTAIGTLWAIWRRPTDRAADDPPTLQPSRFLAVWIALLATLLVGIPALAATGFAVWLLPW